VVEVRLEVEIDVDDLLMAGRCLCFDLEEVDADVAGEDKRLLRRERDAMASCIV
jgi:hypothetical protein